MSAVLNQRAGGTRARVPIALVTSSMEGGGAQRAVAKLAAGLVQQGHSVDLVLAHARGPYLDELPAAVRVVDLEVSRVATAVVPLARYLRRERPQVVFSVLDYVNVVSVAARALSRVDVRLVVSERNHLSAVVANRTRRRTRLMPWLVRWAYPRADAVVAVSQGVAEDLVNGFGIEPSRVHVMNNPVVTPETLRMREETPRHPWLRQPEVPVVLAVGRLMPQKDFGTLLEAFALVRKEREARLVILGEGPLRPELESAVQDLGLAEDVDLAGFDPNPYSAMAAASVFVLSSRWEGSPGVLIEALSCGTPVVATDCPSGPRQILDGGRFGRLVPVGDVPSLTAGLVDALDGRVPHDCRESWAPYEQAAVVAAYVDLLRGEDSA